MEELRISLSSGEIRYLRTGSGPPLLFLHGGFATPRGYTPLLERLGAHYTVIAPTHPGHGDSFMLPNSWKLEQFGNLYKEFFRALHLTPGPIVSHSFGGAIGFLLASYGMATKLIAFDTVGLPIPLSPEQYVRAITGEARSTLTEIKKFQQFQDMVSAASTIVYSAVRHPENHLWLLANCSTMDLTELFKKITVPVFLFWGADDAIVPLSVGEKIKACLPHATLTVYPGRGHAFIATDPEFSYNELIKVLP